MNSEQLLEQVFINRDIISKRNEHALEHLEMLKKDFAHLINEEIDLNIELNNSLYILYFNSNYTAAIDNSMAVLERFKNSDNKYLLALHLKMVGHCCAHTGEQDLAERYLLDALETLPAEEKYNGSRADIFHELAMTTEFKDTKSESIKNYLVQALELLDGENHAIRKANCLMGIGNYYNNIDEVDKALENYLLATETFEKKYILINMGNCYSNIGSCYVKLGDFDLAEKFLDKALELRLKSGSLEQLGISYFNLGVLYMARGEFDRSEEVLSKALRMVEEIGNKPFVNRINETLYNLALKRNKVEVA